MARDDLMSLTVDDLASLTNRGTVKRAERELTACQLEFEIKEDSDGHLLVKWSDGIECVFQAGGAVHEARCSSGAVGITRHIIRSVLAYQKYQRGGVAPANDGSGRTSGEVAVVDSLSPSDAGDRFAETTEQTVAATDVQGDSLAAWDPGEFTDNDLLARFGKGAIQRARTRFEAGTLVELTRGSKPFATFLDENCFVRFMVRGDLRYVAADCSEATLARFVAMAVWAFRKLPKDQQVGLLSLQQSQPEVPVSLLQQLQVLLDESFGHGIARAPNAWLARLTRLEEAMRKDSLVWPAELLCELSHEIELYAQHDARFEPQRVVFLVGELIARSRAIHRNLTTVPQLLIRGSRFDRPIDIASARYVGIGMSVRPGRAQTTFNAFFQDADTGILATVERTFSNQSEKSFQELAQTTLYRGITLAGLAGSQILLKSGKRMASGELVLPRSASAFASNPQSFQWEQLKPPLAAESFAHLASRWAFLPPSYLRPRRRTDGLHVVAIARVENACFNPVEQRIEAGLVDHGGRVAKMVLPFHARGASGFDRFLVELESHGDAARFIAGHVTMANQQLTILPLAVVIELGEIRHAIFPLWSQDRDANKTQAKAVAGFAAADVTFSDQGDATNPLKQFFDRLCHFNGEIVLLGIESGADTIERLAAELIEVATSIGFLRIAALIEQLRNELMRGKNDFHHDITKSIQLAQQLSLIGRIEAM